MDVLLLVTASMSLGSDDLHDYIHSR
jgi:hypothetical protein